MSFKSEWKSEGCMNNESAKSTWEDDLTGVEEVSQRQRDWGWQTEARSFNVLKRTISYSQWGWCRWTKDWENRVSAVRRLNRGDVMQLFSSVLQRLWSLLTFWRYTNQIIIIIILLLLLLLLCRYEGCEVVTAACIHCVQLLNQWREGWIGVVCQDLWPIITSRAREFWIYWRRVIWDVGKV